MSTFGGRFQYSKVNSEEPNDQELTEIPITNEIVEPQLEVQQQQQNTDATAPESSQDSQTTAQPTPVAQTTPTVIQNANDGVFSNVIVTPPPPPKYEEDVLPSYNEALDGTSPLSRFRVSLMSDEDSDIFEGRRVGNGWTFFFSTMISWFFGILGFICVHMMSQTHAGKMGARAGFGLMAIQFGFYVRKYYYLTQEIINGEESQGSQGSQGNPGSDSQEMQLSPDAEEFSVWLSYLFMILGWFIFVKALMEFVRLRHAVRAAH